MVQRQVISAFFPYIKISKIVALLELFSFIRLTKLPICWSNTVRCKCPAATGCYLKRKWLPYKIDIALPVLSPVSRHRYPPRFRALHFHCYYFTIQSHISYQDLAEVSAPAHCESYPIPSLTVHPTQCLHK